MDKVVITVAVLILSLLVSVIWVRHGGLTVQDVIGDVDAPELLKNKMEEFKGPRVLKVADGVHVAVNYALANSIMLEGTDGKVIVDTTESLDAANEIAAEFSKITKKVTRAIIYTHHHADHIMGAQAFISESNPKVEIWAHRLFDKEEKRVILKGTAHAHRAMSQFGVYIPDSRHTAGIGGMLRYKDGQSYRMPPTHIVDNDVDITVAGMKLRLIHIPGESSDQMGVWLPEKRILLCADDIYKAFPNLYAIRGVTPRDVMDWAESLDKMRQLRPQCIVGSHGLPVCGEDEIYELLSNYMYGIQYVHDQTVRYINKGVHPDEIAKIVKLPDNLANHPYLIQYYGTVHWSVKAVYIMYMGWFSGEAVDLDPLTPSERADRMLKLVGKKKLLRAAESALYDSDYQWALELATHIHRLEPDNTRAKRIRHDAMAKLAASQISAPGRNFYLTEMIHDEKLIPKRDMTKFVKTLPLENVFRAMRSRVKVEEIPVGEDIQGCFHFTDTGLFVATRIHNGILEVKYEQVQQPCSFKLTTTETVWKSLIAKERSNIGAYLMGDIKVEGGLFVFTRFLGYIERD